jgi:DNA (cytosine-5)-methyltransferase 1
VLLACDNDCDATITYLANLGAYPLDLQFVDDEAADEFEEYITKRQKAWKKKHPGMEGLPFYSGSDRPERYDPGVLHFLFGDVSKVSGQEILDIIGMEKGELDLVVGGPPCQGFSYAGSRKIEDARNSLVFDFARLCVEMQPRSLCMENVPGILSMKMPDGRSVVDEVCRILERGDFGEFDALRQMLSEDPTKRLARRKRKGPKKSPEEKKKKSAEPKQQSLF